MTALVIAGWAAMGLCALLVVIVLVVRARIAADDRRARGRRTEVSAILRTLLVNGEGAPAPRSTVTLHAIASVASRVRGEDREAIQRWLRDNGAPVVARRGMRGRRPIDRARAVRLYVRSTVEPSMRVLIRMLDDADLRVRSITALEWGSTGRDDAIEPVMAAACRDERRLPPLVASIAIMRCRLLDAESLHAAWSTRDPDGLRVALSTGSAAGIAAVQPYALQSLDHDDVLVRIAAVDALRRIGTRRAVEPLQRRAAIEGNAIVRHHVAEALTVLS